PTNIPMIHRLNLDILNIFLFYLLVLAITTLLSCYVKIFALFMIYYDRLNAVNDGLLVLIHDTESLPKYKIKFRRLSKQSLP
ncbi:MAG TPA: hypothetical protein VKA95_06890, partial [Nitrososphaeraceae archaeon]|nr:hypothetical protein [Nitrososphaeraceae archaeon]